MLINELERALLRGEEIPGGNFLLQEVRSAVRESGAETPRRVDSPMRLFFVPVEPFLVDDIASKIQGRIARTSIEPIWTWISRDVMAADARAFGEAVAAAANDKPLVERLVREFQDLTAERCSQAFAAGANDKLRRRLMGQLGTAHVLDDARDVVEILRRRDALAAIAERLPDHIRNLADATLDASMSALDMPRGQRDGMLSYALVLVMSRLAAPWQLIRLAIAAAQSDDANKIAATPYEMAVAIVLADIERMVGVLKADLKRGSTVAVAALLKCIHDAARGVRTELDLPVDSAWGRQLAAIRADISDTFRNHIEPVPARVRRLLRPRPVSEIQPNSVLDASDVDEVESMIELVSACRNYASELAISEMTTRAYGELHQYLDTGTQTLLDGLRAAEPKDRSFRQSQVDAAVRFCAKIFGPDYAALLTKAAEVAAQGERSKAAARA